jgi:hypothetical protein
MTYENNVTLTTDVIRPFDPAIIGFSAMEIQLELVGTSAKYLKGGKSPTPTIGFTLQSGGTLIITNEHQISELRMCAISGTGNLQIFARG